MAVSDSQASALRQILTFGGAILAGIGITNAEQAATLVNSLSVAIPALVSIGSVVWSIVNHYGKKKVPVEATAIILPEALKEPVGATVDLSNIQTAKVVG